MKSALEIIHKNGFPDVKRVVDAKQELSLRVTRGDVRDGKSKKPDSCALAVRCKRDGFDGALIYMSVAYLVKGAKAFRYMVPISVARELVSFDRAQDFRKGEYTLNSVRPSQRLGAPARRPSATHNHTSTGRQPGLKRRGHRTEGVRVYA